MSKNKEMAQVVRWARSLGWTEQFTGGCHYKFVHPEFGFIFTSSSPSCQFAFKKMRAAMLRRMRENNVPIPEDVRA